MSNKYYIQGICTLLLVTESDPMLRQKLLGGVCQLLLALLVQCILGLLAFHIGREDIRPILDNSVVSRRTCREYCGVCTHGLREHDFGHAPDEHRREGQRLE